MGRIIAYASGVGLACVLEKGGLLGKYCNANGHHVESFSKALLRREHL
jgi:hypothetical protein